MAFLDHSKHDLVILVREGESEAFGHLVSQYQTLAFRLAWIMLGQEGEAREAAEAAFTRAWENSASLKVDAPLRPWMFSFIASEIRQRLRSRHRWFNEWQDSPDHIPTKKEVAGGELSVFLGDTSSELRGAISRLSEGDRRVFIMRHALGLSKSEMAELLDISSANVGTHLERISEQLETAFNDFLEEDDHHEVWQELEGMQDEVQFPETPPIAEAVSRRIAPSHVMSEWLPYALVVAAILLVVLLASSVGNAIESALGFLGF